MPEGERGTARFGDAEFDLGWVRAGHGELDREGEKLIENIGALAAQTGAYGADFLLLTYASRFSVYREANRTIRRAARASGARLIDLSKAFEPLCPEKDCPRHLFPDHHPNASGYQVIAKTIAAQLRDG